MDTTGHVYELGGLKIEFYSHRVYVDGKEIDLTNREYKILLVFIKHPDWILNRGMIIDGAWGRDHAITERTVDSHVQGLRREFGRRSACIETIHGEGYRFNPKKV